MLPDGSGLDLCRELKSNPALKEIPIIILTAKDDEVDKVVGFELGADDYVTKPFSVRELILRVKAVLKRNQKTATPLEINRSFGSLVMDIESHEVFIDDEEITLTALEFKLLNQLVERRGRVQTRDQLLSDVWGYSSDVTTRTVDTHIKRLREKLGVMGKYIQTIRGVGYKLSRTPE
jgi:two-component system phosphate regulon response regulator PhoB